MNHDRPRKRTMTDAFLLNGRQISYSRLLSEGISADQFSEFEIKTLKFIKAYLSGWPDFDFYTSGSVGRPKLITFHRSRLQASAERTNTFFGLLPGCRVLSCMNPEFAAGKMMIVRALHGKLHLTVQIPDSNPLRELPENRHIDFIALTPLQLQGVLEHTPGKLAQVSKVLVGGAGLSSDTEERLQGLKTKFFHSYAMTETLTHVAIRAVNGSEKAQYYRALPGVTFALDERNCLVIKDDCLGIDRLVTNDMAELTDAHTFLWKGRYDNVINSGGIKILTEETELKINDILRSEGFDYPICLLSSPDKLLGEKTILLIEERQEEFEGDHLARLLKSRLPKYHDPKIVKSVPEIFLTPTGKIDRIKNSKEYL